MNKKLISIACFLAGVLFFVVLFFAPFNDTVKSYMIVTGSVLIFGSILILFLKKIYLIIFSLIGIDLILLPVVLTVKETMSAQIIGGADFPTFWLLYSKMNSGAPFLISLIGLLLLTFAIVADIVIANKKR